MRTLRFVPQRKSTECGVACVAMLASVSLSAARKAVGCSSYTDIDEIRTALNDYGICLGRKVKARTWNRLLDRKAEVTALVATGYRRAKEKWHWVLCVGNSNSYEILNPRTRRRSSYGRLRIAWYHLVEWRKNRQ